MFRRAIKKVVDTLIYAESAFIRPAITKKKVLILRKDGLGDCIIFYPTLKAYRDFYKDAEITLIFPKYFLSLAPLLGKELVDKVIWFDHKAFSNDFGYRRRFLLDLKRAGYHTAIYPVFSRERIGDFMMKITRAKEVIGFDGDSSVQGEASQNRGNKSYTRLITSPEEIVNELARDEYFVNEITGTEIKTSFPSFDISKLPAVDAAKIMANCGLSMARFAIVFPGAGAPYRIWPATNWTESIDYIVKKGIIPVICGSDKEVSLAEQIISLVSPEAKTKIINLVGKTDLATLAHILARSSFYIGSDTGILHLAVAVGTPTIAPVGSGGLWRFFPYGDPAKNIAIYDKSRSYETGSWKDAENLKPGEIHPSILAIHLDNMISGLDRLLNVIR